LTPFDPFSPFVQVFERHHHTDFLGWLFTEPSDRCAFGYHAEHYRTITLVVLMAGFLGYGMVGDGFAQFKRVFHPYFVIPGLTRLPAFFDRY
jgi:hypothetical protein